MIKFGTDGWRAVIADDFTFENLKLVSQAISDYLKGRGKAVIGYDRRFLSKEFAQTVASVFAANNIKVALADRDVPTPAVSFHCLRGKYDLGIMITASHNPAKFNGLKIKTSEGGSADKAVTNKVESLLGKTKVKCMDLEEAQKKKLVREKDLTEDYVEFLKGFVSLKKIKSLKLKVLVDTMYGTGDNFVERVLCSSNVSPVRGSSPRAGAAKRASNGVKIDYLHNEFNPSFGGIHPEPVESNLAEMIKIMKKGKYDLGVVLDGDADRIAMIDGKGNYINAQVILPLLAVHMIKNRQVRGGIGKTVVGSDVIDKVALAYGVACYETPVGFKYISNLFREGLICIGGEEAGGIGFKGYIPERDGSASFLLLLEMLAMEREDFNTLLSDFYKQFGRHYYSRTAIPVKSVKKSLSDIKLPAELFGEKVERVNTLDGIKLITKKYWLMFRKSGTEPIVRVYSEGRNEKEVDKLVALGKKMVYAL